MITRIDTGSAKIVGFTLSGKLHDQDYQVFVPAVEAALAEQGKLRLLAQFEDFHGWDMHAAWDDLKFGVKHYADFERVAMVGDQVWEEWMAKLCRPFTSAELKYFDSTEQSVALDWLRESL